MARQEPVGRFSARCKFAPAYGLRELAAPGIERGDPFTVGGTRTWGRSLHAAIPEFQSGGTIRILKQLDLERLRRPRVLTEQTPDPAFELALVSGLLRAAKPLPDRDETFLDPPDETFVPEGRLRRRFGPAGIAFSFARRSRLRHRINVW